MRWPLSENHSYILLAIFLLVALVETGMFIFFPEETWSTSEEASNSLCGDGMKLHQTIERIDH